MNRPYSTSLIFLGIIALLQNRDAWSRDEISLEQCFRSALKKSDTLAGQVELINQAEEHISQAWAAFMPTVSTSATVMQQQDPGSLLGQSLFPANQNTVKLGLTQNLFKGFRDFAALKQRKSEREATEAGREQAKVQLFQDTAQGFYNVLAYEYDLKNYQSEIEANQKRKAELSDLKRLARAREADIVSIDSSIASLEASVSATRGMLQVARETLAFLTGIDSQTALMDTEEYPLQIEALDSLLSQVEKRPDILQGRQALDAAEHSVWVARGGHLPTADITANYYFTRPGVYSAVNWDVQLTASFALFSGGNTQSQVREAASQLKGKEVNLDQLRKQAERDIRSVYTTVVNDLEQVSRLAKAVELSKEKYQLYLKDNRGGLASNVDVLQALASAYQTQRTYDHTRMTTKYDYARLQAITVKRKWDESQGN